MTFNTTAADKLLGTGNLFSRMGALIDAAGWSHEESNRAMARHPKHADDLYHAANLCQTEDDVMVGNEWLYRAHAREVLERVRAGRDTRPGTDVEVVLACRATSLLAPLHGSAFTLYMRVWARRFPGRPVMADDGPTLAEYERMYGSSADDAEAWVRRRLLKPGRVLRDVGCRGMHNGEPAICKYMVGSSVPEPVAVDLGEPVVDGLGAELTLMDFLTRPAT
jgi:hypothetical protein